MFLSVCLFAVTAYAQNTEKLVKQNPKGQILRIDHSIDANGLIDNEGLVGLYVVHSKGITSCTHNRVASKMSIKYPKNGKYASQLQKEVEIGTLQFSKIYITDIGNGEGFLMMHRQAPSECNPFKHTWSKSRAN